MTLAAQTAESAARALAIAGFAVALAQPLARLLTHTHGRRRTLAWALLLAPLLTPALLVSYAYSHLALRLMAVPGGIAVLYAVVLALKLTPVAAVIAHFVPPALSAEAAHCHALLAGPRWRRWIFRLRGAGRTPVVAGGIVFLLAFTDFELASLWSLKTWTVALFDAQAGGLALGASLRLAALPLMVETAALAGLLRRSRLAASPRGAGFQPVEVHRASLPGVASTASDGHRTFTISAESKPLSIFARRACSAYLVCAALLASVVPLARIVGQAAAGLRSIAENFVLTRELAASTAFALGAALCAWPIAAWIARRRGLALALCLPGLLGAMLLALFILTAFQLPPLRAAYDTPLPLLLALTLLLLPLAVPLRWLLDAARRSPALHLARLAGARPVIWHLDTRRRWLAACLLFCWGYFDFTASSILAPVGLTPVFARLHNLAHYGQTAVLSAMLLAAAAVPVLALPLSGLAARFFAGRK